MDVEGPIPFDEDMIERAGATLNDLVGHHIKHGASNPYIDVDDYVKRLCRLYAEQTLNAAFHGVAKMQTWTAEQVREDSQSALERLPNGRAGEAPNACFYFTSVNGPTSGIVSRHLDDLFGRDATACAQRFAKGLV